MLDYCGIERKQFEGRLYAEADCQGRDDGSRADHAAQAPTDKNSHELDASAADADRELCLSGEGDHEAVPGTGSESRTDVVVGSQGDDEHACKHHCQTKSEIAGRRNQLKHKDAVQEYADENHVENRAQTEFFSEHDGYCPNGQSCDYGSGSDADACRFRKTHMEDLPWSVADVRLQCEYNSKRIKKEAP